MPLKRDYRRDENKTILGAFGICHRGIEGERNGIEDARANLQRCSSRSVLRIPGEVGEDVDEAVCNVNARDEDPRRDPVISSGILAGTEVWNLQALLSTESKAY